MGLDSEAMITPPSSYIHIVSLVGHLVNTQTSIYHKLLPWLCLSKFARYCIPHSLVLFSCIMTTSYLHYTRTPFISVTLTENNTIYLHKTEMPILHTH